MTIFAAEATHRTRRFGEFCLRVTRRTDQTSVPADVIVLTRGNVTGGEAVPCRISSACVTSTALDSAECDCDLQTEAALGYIASEGRGVLIYLTGQEGRGHGLRTKVRALANKNAGHDTFAAVEMLGKPADVRAYDAVKPILDALDVVSVVLLSGNPDKMAAVAALGVKVDQALALPVEPHSAARTSMRAKRDRGHDMAGRYADARALPYP